MEAATARHKQIHTDDAGVIVVIRMCFADGLSDDCEACFLISFSLSGLPFPLLD